MEYKNAGVNIEEGMKFVKNINHAVKGTFSKNVLSDIGGFGALNDASFKDYKEPVLVSSADGVGTKIKIAVMSGKHRGIGTDIVNHCVDDIAVLGAKPLYFLDYLAFGQLKSNIAESIISGMIDACLENNLALIGGETAEMPGMYGKNDYDVAGFIVGVVEKGKILNGNKIKAGDIVVGIKSKSLHTNGFSLARKILFDTGRLSIDKQIPVCNSTIGDILLEPHRSYLCEIQWILHNLSPHAFAHITGGGLYDNIERILPEGTGVKISRKWEIPYIFDLIIKMGNVPSKDAFRTFNMGIGLVSFIDRSDINKIKELKDTVLIGEVVKSDKGVQIEGVDY
ncbi:phosphoribosylformylglycinamidine cyclo-ligase [candidate division WOR-3 bacterium]|nr:phosphoribosylformylglycinamidine cyclo-ligase [candidate division WOR-3 bacterium]